MAINLNVNPYYDDYDEDKGFHRILFKPGVAVQARELTQLQTIMQKQVERMGKHFFEEGAMVIPGQIAIDTNVRAVKLTTASVGPTNLATLFDGQNKVIEGLTTGVEALVLLGINAEGDDAPTLIVRFTKNGTDFTTSEFAANENVRIKSTATSFQVNETSTNPITKSSIASIQEGVYFAAKSFVKVLAQTITLEKYSNTPSFRVGLSISEEIVTEVDDSTLYDNALGYPNESAPGADRYKIGLILSKLSLTSELDQDFFELARIENGIILKSINKTQYSILERTLARRTFDESGNYTVNPFRIQVREHRNNNRGAWAASTAYLQGDVVSYNSNTYVALSSATSSASPPTHGFGEATAGVTWLYTDRPLYNLGVYTPTQGGDSTKLAVGIEPGKAYINGYEVEKIATQYVPVPKARDYRSVSAEQLTTTIGNHVLVSNVYINTASGFDIASFSTVNLYDQITSTAGTAAGTKVGTASVRAMYYHSGNASLTNSIFKLSLFNINMNEGKTIERNVKQFSNTNVTIDIAGFNSDYPQLPGTISVSTTTVTGQGTTFTSDVVAGDYIYIDSTKELLRVSSVTNDYSLTLATSGTTATASRYYRAQMPLKEPENTPALFEFPQSAVKSTSSPTYYTLKPLYNSTNGSGQFIATNNNFNTASTLGDFVIINRNTGRTYAGTSITVNPTSITISGLTNSENYTVLAPIAETTTARTKTATTVSKLITNANVYSATEILLDYSDVYEVNSVKMITGTGNVDISEWFDFDNGQRSTHYGISKLIRKSEYGAPTSSIRIDYRYFAHSGGGTFFDVTSYSGIPYEKIPVFYGDNIVVRLSDVLDFRPVANASITNTTSFLTSYLPHRTYRTTISYDHYLPRTDKVSIDLRGNIFSTQGASAVIPQDPANPSSGMTLYKLNLSPYTLDTRPPSVTYDYIDNKRYTMRDIGELERRIENVEYYTALSLLEQDTSAMSIRDSLGLERFKNGFIVDNFEGHGVGDVNSTDYKCSINMENNELRPFYTMDNINLVEKDPSTRSTNKYQVSGDLVTLKYSDTVLVNQSYASRVENVNPFAVASFNGRVSINPPSDEWFETEVRPEIVINEEGNFDAITTALQSSGALGTIWNAWQTQWTGTPVTTGTRTETAVLQRGIGTDFDQRFGARQTEPWAGPQGNNGVGVRSVTLQSQLFEVGRARTGVRTNVVSRIDRRVIDDRVVSTATIPFMRSRRIAFVGRNFKPNTRIFSFFDEIDVSSYITPASNVAVTPGFGTFNAETSAEIYGEESERNPRRVNGNAEAAFNKGDIVYVSYRSSTSYALTNSPGTAVLGFYGAGNVMYLHNIQGNFLSSDTVTGSISGANATLLAAVTAQTQGANLVTNSNGDVVGVFNLPNTSALRFRTGTRELVLTDSALNSRILANTQGRVSYSATGTLQTRQATVAATRNADVVREVVRETDSITQSSENITNDTGWYDPLAQTFLIDVKSGCFLTKVDIFFQSKDASLPVTLEIRNTVNGYPGKRILPFSSVTLMPEQVSTSSDATVATSFTFKSPVYVEENGEYCIVLLSDSTEYKVWISQLGDEAVGSDRRISQQPYAGVLFKSQNASTWTADQLQDLKFKLYRASFDTSGVGTFSLVNESVPSRNLPFNALQFKSSSRIVTVLHPSHGMASGSNVTLSGFDGGYNIPAANINATHTIGNVLTDTYTITVGNTATSTVTVGSGNIKATEDLVFNVMQPIVEFRNFTGTDVTFRANTSPATFFSSRGNTPVTVLANENNYFSSPQAIKSTVNETSTSGTGRKSFELVAHMTSTVDNLSPVIDLNRSSLITVSNKIDNTAANVTYFVHDENTLLSSNVSIRFSGNAISTIEGNAANVLGRMSVGKTLYISGASNAANNGNIVIAKVTNVSGVANVETFTTFVTEAPGSSVTLIQRERFVDERAYIGGSSVSKYVTRQINLAKPSTFLRVMFAANVPKEGEIDVYYRTLAVGATESLSTQNYRLLQPQASIIKTEDPAAFSDVTYEIDDLPQFTALTVKLVFRSTNSSQVPSIKDLRIVACP